MSETLRTLVAKWRELSNRYYASGEFTAEAAVDNCAYDLEAAIPPSAGTWQDIATAPKDGTRVLVVHRGTVRPSAIHRLRR